MILDLVESKPQIQWFTHEILWNKAQVWNSQSLELISLSTCSKIVLKIVKKACFTKAIKSPRSLLKGPQESSPIVKGSIRRNPSLFIIKFLNGPRRLQHYHGKLKGLVMPSETLLTKRSFLHLHQAANSTSLEPSDHSTSSQAKISSMGFFYLSFV